MASPFLFLIRRPIQTTTPLALCLGFSTALVLARPLIQPRLAYCDSPSPIARPSSPISESLHSYSHDAKVPVFLDGWRPNPAAYRQISAGSILGLAGGVAVSMFSRTLAIVFGLAILGVQVSWLLHRSDARRKLLPLYGAGHRKLTRKGCDWYQYMASKGINVIPTARLQQYVKGIDLRSAIEDNAAFKLSFGTTFALASLAEF